jgi:hypothetical protein
MFITLLSDNLSDIRVEFGMKPGNNPTFTHLLSFDIERLLYVVSIKFAKTLMRALKFLLPAFFIFQFIGAEATWVPVSGTVLFSGQPMSDTRIYLSFDSTSFKPKDSTLTASSGNFGFYFYTFYHKGYFVLSFFDCSNNRKDIVIHYDISGLQTGGITLEYCETARNQKFLGGKVFTASGKGLQDATIRIFHYNFSNRKVEWLKDLTTDASGFYGMKAEVGLYILKYIPNKQTGTYYSAMYYPDFLFWKDAEVLEISEITQAIAHFRVLPLRPQAGPNKILGTLIGKPNLLETPNGQIPVSVLDVHGKPVATVCTDSAGNFEISGLADGTYQVWVDFPGLITDAPPIELSKTDSVQELAIYFTDGGISYDLYTSEPEYSETTTMRVYPNPARNNIRFEGVDFAEIEISDLQGKVILEAVVSKSKPYIFVGDLPEGSYLLKDNYRQTVYRFMKQ